MERTFGRYRLLERLGEGGMAEVWKAKSFGVEGFEKLLVIKRILPQLAAHRAFIDLFIHEAKLSVMLAHANIVQVFDLGRVEAERPGERTSYFMAMEWVPGVDLASLLSACRKAKRQVPVGVAAFIAGEIAKALDHAHRRRDETGRPLGIVHRDISPHNVLLSWDGQVKVTDFGIAKARDSLSESEINEARAGRVRGKLAYMSPEQSRGEEVDGRSDLFSLGTVLFEMLSGSHPFSAPSRAETLRRLQAAEYPPLELSRPDVPSALPAILSRLLAPSPDARMAQAAELHEALLGFSYASGERAGAPALAEFLEPLHEARTSPRLEVGAAFEEEPTGSAERTPVEIPQAGAKRSISGLFDRSELLQLGERREVTGVVFALPIERAQVELDRAAEEGPGSREPAERVREVLARFGAHVVEQEAGSVAAIFGLGDEGGRDAEAAVRAALVATRAGGGRAGVSAGIHVARILVGEGGEPARDERLASLLSDAQLLARAAEGQVVLSPLASRIVRSAFATESLGEVALPGPGASSRMLEEARVVVSARPPPSALGRFVGRREELRELGQVLARATRRRPQVVLVTGPSGIGKTRLLAEAERRLARGGYGVGFYVASCPRRGQKVPGSGLDAMLSALCGVQEGDEEARVLDVAPRLRALGLEEDETSAVLAELGARRAGSSLRPGELGPALVRAFARMVKSLCADGVHAFVWDDADELDDATVDLLERLARKRNLRAVFVLATRNEPPAALAELEASTRVRLEELSEAETAELLSARIGARILPPELLKFCRERAGGHPLFLEELLRELEGSGAVRVLSGDVRLKLEGEAALPRSLRALIAARISRLAPEERRTLQAAAILGEPVPTGALASMLGRNMAQVDRSVGRLASAELLRVLGPDLVGFASPAHGEVVLDAILPEARRDLHAAAARAFQEAPGWQEYASRIAEHLYQAGERSAAASFFAQAAQASLARRKLESAVRLMLRALDLADHETRAPGELCAWLELLSDAASRVRSAPDFLSTARRMLSRIDEAGSVSERVLARVAQARVLAALNAFEEAYARIAEAEALAGGDARLRRRALAAENEMAVRSGDYARALRVSEQLEAPGPVDDPRLLLAIASARAASGDSEAALSAIARAERLIPEGDLVASAECAKQRVLVHLYARNPEAAVAASTRAVDLSRSAGLRFGAAAALHNLGDSLRRLGDLPRAYAALCESLSLCEGGGYERLASLNRVHLAYLDGLRGDASAEPLMRELIRYAEARGYHTDALDGRLLLGCLLVHLGRREEARAELDRVIELARGVGNRLIEADALAARASA